MSEKKQQTAYPLRMSPSLREQLELLASDSKRSLNAEITARLEASLDVEAALTQIAPGCPITEAAQLILDLAAEREEAVENLHQFNLEVHAKELNQRFAYSEARLDKIESRIEYMIEQFQLSKQQ